MSEVHEARVEAAAAALAKLDGTRVDLVPAWAEAYKNVARAALAAADAVVTEEAIGRAIIGRTATAGAKAVQRLYRGEAGA